MKYTNGQISDMKRPQRLLRKFDRIKIYYALQKHFLVYPPMMSKSQIRAVAIKNGIIVPPNSTKSALVNLLLERLSVQSKFKPKKRK